MPRIRVSRSGKGRAVRTPVETAYYCLDLVTHPATPSLKAAVAELKRMPKPSRTEKRIPIEMPRRKRG